MGEQSLPGGFVTSVVRAGNTVRRALPEDPEFVRALLGWFERHGWAGAPRFLGTYEQGRQVLSFIDGHMAWEPVQPPSVWTVPPVLARYASRVHRDPADFLAHLAHGCLPWRLAMIDRPAEPAHVPPSAGRGWPGAALSGTAGARAGARAGPRDPTGGYGVPRSYKGKPSDEQDSLASPNSHSVNGPRSPRRMS